MAKEEVETVPNDGMWTTLAMFLFGAAAGCLIRGWHDAHRTPLGTQKCRNCQKSFRDLEEAGLGDADLRQTRLYDRDEGSLVRKQGYDEDPDGRGE